MWLHRSRQAAALVAVAAVLSGTELASAFSPEGPSDDDELRATDCGAGQTIVLANGEDTLVSRWLLSGNCTIWGGVLVPRHQLRYPGIVSMAAGSLHIKGTNFEGVRLEFDGEQLVVEGAKFVFHAGAPEVLYGGAIRVASPGPEGSVPETVAQISDSVFLGTRAKLGGAILAGIHVGEKENSRSFNGNVQLLVHNCTFRGTRAYQFGGAIYAAGAFVRVSASQFDKTSALPRKMANWVKRGEASGGGVIAVFGTVLKLLHSRIDVASAVKGGAIYAAFRTNEMRFQRTYSAVKTWSTTFHKTAAISGGTVFVIRSNVVMIRVTVDDSAAGIGPSVATTDKSLLPFVRGGVITGSSSSVSVRRSVFLNTASATYGGAIFSDGVDLSIQNLTIRNTKAELAGGALYLKLKPCKTNCEIEALLENLTIVNAESRQGGAIFAIPMHDMTRADSNRLAFRNLEIDGAKATEGYGGAMHFITARAQIEASIIQRVSSSQAGGALALEEAASVFMIDSVISNSAAGKEGGAVWVEEASFFGERLEVSDTRSHFGAAIAGSDGSNITLRSTVARNCSATEFGGVFWMDSAFLDATDLLVEDVKAHDQGGVAWLQNSTARFDSSTFSNGHAGIEGGGFFVFQGDIVIHNSRLSHMTPDFALAAKSSFDLRNASLVGIENRFAVFTDTKLTMTDMHGECPTHTELMDQSMDKSLEAVAYRHLECSVCNSGYGIWGHSGFETHAKCFRCAPHSFGYADKGCLCEEGFAMYELTVRTVCIDCDAVGMSCQAKGLSFSCPEGAPKSECESAHAEDGFWKLRHSDYVPQLCPYGPACHVTENDLCAEGYTGPLCMVCKDGLYRQSRYTACGSCKDAFGPFHKGVVLVLSAGLIGAAMRSAKVRERSEETMARWIGSTSYIMNKARIALLTTQVFGIIVQMRLQSKEVMDSLLPFAPAIKFDIMASKHFARCVLGAGTYTHYIILLVQIPLMFIAARLVSRTFRISAHTLRILVYNLMLTTITEESLLFFPCDASVEAMTRRSYLTKDYSVTCQGATFMIIRCLAGLVLIIWCGVIPGYLFFQMWKQREKLNPRVMGPLNYSVTSPDGLSIGLELVAEHQEAMHCYGKATMQHFAQMQDSATVSRAQADSIRALAAGCIRTRLNSTQLLKQGLRASAECQDPGLRAYRHLYAAYRPERWYYEFIFIYGRIGFVTMMVFPSWVRVLMGILLAAGQLFSLMYGPFRRQSDTIMATICYASILGLFIVDAVQGHEHFRNLVSGICLVLPLSSFVFFVFKAHFLPSRKYAVATEAADHIFDEMFCRMKGVRLRPTERVEIPVDIDSVNSSSENSDAEAPCARPTGSSSSRPPPGML